MRPCRHRPTGAPPRRRPGGRPAPAAGAATAPLRCRRSPRCALERVRGRVPRLPRGDDGVSAVELVVLVPLLLGLLFVGVQVGQVMLGNQAALAAAREAARVARAGGGEPAALAAGAARGEAYAAQVGRGVLTGTAVTVTPVDGGLGVRAVVTGDAYALVPALGGRITQVAEGPVEVFRADS